MEKKPKIKVIQDGPYILSGLENIRQEEGADLRVKKSAALCRCGKSKSFPYCDGIHEKINFSGSKLPGRKKDKTVSYRGDDITINDNRGACSHDGACFKNLPEVFRPKEWRWIKAKKASREEIIDTVKKCPSGALSYTLDGVEYKNYDRSPAVKLDPRGPLNAEGYVELDDPRGSTPEAQEHYSLCRCGKSKNKPFCDGMHLPGVFDKKKEEESD
ncbi:MAG: CDGSH iron-sulfur domain-containing protein [Elusimicrobiota bacterium]